LIGKSFNDYIHQEDRQRIETVNKNIITNTSNQVPDTPQDVEYIYRLMCKDGSYKWVYDYTFATFENQNLQNEVYGYLLDINDLIINQDKLQQYEITIKESYRKLKAISDSTADIFILIDKNYKILSFNKAAQSELKEFYDKEVKEGDNFFQYIVKGTEEGFKKHFAKALSGEIVVVELPLLQYPNGEKKYKQFKYFPVYEEDTILGVSFNVIDITAQKEKEIKIQESESRFRNMADTAPMMIWMTEKGKGCIYFNKSWIDFTGRSLEENQGHGWLDSVHSEDRNQCISVCDNAIDEQKPFEMKYRLRRYDGKYRWVLDRGIPRVTEKGEFLGHIGSCVDITDLQETQDKLEEKTIRLEHALQESNKLSMIVRNTNDMVVLADKEGRITWINEAFTKVTGYTLDEVFGKKPGPLLQGAETDFNTQERLKQAIWNLEEMQIEILNYTKRHEKYWVELRIQPIYDNSQELIGFISIQSVITQRKEAEQKILIRNKILQEIAFIQSHELRRPVANILGLLYLIDDEPNPYSENIKIYLEHLKQVTNDLDAIIHRIVHKTYYEELDMDLLSITNP
jgi:PAS domain S-box-containing protein